MTSKPGCEYDFGMSLAGVRLLARRCPACRWREPGLRRSSGTGEGVSRTPPASADERGESRSRVTLGAASEYPLPGTPADRPVVVVNAL